MNKPRKTVFDGELEVVATLAGNAIDASIRELRKQDELTVALRSAMRSGVNINELSNASGLSPKEIRRRVSGELNFGEDILFLAGLR